MNGRRVLVLAVVAAMLVGGAFILTLLQTQHLFRDSAIALEEGRIPRNDGAIIAAAVLIGTGIALFLALGSTLHPADRIVPAAVAGTCSALLVALHFTIFVNSIMTDDFSVASFTASFVIHAASYMPALSVFFIAMTTMLLLGLIARSVWRLYGATSFRAHLGDHASPAALRNEVVLSGIFVVATLLFFAGAFLTTAVRLEADPQASGASNVVLLYYLLVFALGLLALAAAAKGGLLAWRQRWLPSLRHPQRILESLATAELVLVSLVALLNLLILVTFDPAADTMDPRLRGDLVFVYTDRGLSFLLWFVLLPYAVFWNAARKARAVVLAPEPKPTGRWDDSAVFAALALGGPITIALGTAGLPMTNLTRFILSGAFLSVLLAMRAFHFVLRDGVPSVAVRRDAGAFAVAFFAVAWVTGLMLWGVGNTLEANYVKEGDLVTLTDTELQSFAVAYRFLGSLFFAIPAVVGLDASTRWASPRKFGPLVLVLFGLIAGAHMLFPIAYETPYDPDLATTDVLVGFSTVAQGDATKAFVLVVWSVLAFATVFATSRILTARPSRKPNPSRPETNG